MTWQVIAASAIGAGHLRMELPCQDAFQFQILPERDCVIAAVADGLGSAAQAEQGAKMAVDAALQALQVGLSQQQPGTNEEWEHLLLAAFTQARQSLEDGAIAAGLPLQAFGTTLITVVVTPDTLAVGHLGDGAVVALLAPDQLMTVSPPQRGEYDNETIPLTVPEALRFVRCQAESVKAHCVALLTDGLQNLCINRATADPYAPFFAPFFEALRQQTLDTAAASSQLEQFLGSDRICERTDDDKTLVVIGKLHQPSESDLN